MTKQTKAELLFKSDDQNDRNDLFIAPHVYHCKPDDIIMQDEVSFYTLLIYNLIPIINLDDLQIFGPILGVLVLKDLDEAIEYVNKHEKPLGLYVYTNDEKKAQRVVNETMSGGCTVNGVILHATIPG